jgi:hypothetical protein
MFVPGHPERMAITQPRVARNELPWVSHPMNQTLKGFYHRWRKKMRSNPFRVVPEAR